MSRVRSAAVLAEARAAHPPAPAGGPMPPLGEQAWEALDRAAAAVCDEWSVLSGGDGTSDAVRQPLRVLCVGIRATALGEAPPRTQDFPWDVPIAPLLKAIRRRLVDQSMVAGTAAEHVVPLLAAIERMQDVLEGDVAQTFADQLTGPSALQLLVEVAHDMRSPLGSILFLVERLRKGQSGPVTAVQERQLGLVYGAAFGLSSLAGDVMELARGGDRLVGREAAPFSLSEVLEAVREIVQPIAEEKGLVLRVGGAPPEVRVGHAAALQRVLLNLVTNALKFTQAGEVEIRAEQRSRSRFEFTVRDTGVGIPPRVLAFLFQTFRRRDSPGDYSFSSAGLGLAICSKLITAMNGELRVDSDAASGTRFHFEIELPIASKV
jgi:signal transduction histidine kinase